jgi:hypothetical protein
VAPTKHCSRQKSETWSENVSSHQTSMWQSSLYKNPFMSLQVGNARGDVVASENVKILHHQFQYRSTVVGRKGQTWARKQGQTSNFNRAELPLQVFVCCTVSEGSKRRQRSFRFISFCSNKNNASFHTLTVIALHDSMRWQDYIAIERFSNNPQTTITTWEDWHDVVKIVKRIEQAMKRGKIEGFVMDSRIVKRVE